jgi:hypothetical protein
MKRAMVLFLAALVAVPACAARSAPAVRLVLGRTRVTGHQAQAVDRPEAWRRFAQSLPPGSRIEVTTAEGRKLRGTLIAVEPEGILVNPRTRLPEPPQRVRFDAIASLDLDAGGSHVGRTVAIAAGVSAATVLAVLLALVAVWGD